MLAMSHFYLLILILYNTVSQFTTYQNYSNECLMLENDLCMADKQLLGQSVTFVNTMHEYSFDNMFIIDKIMYGQAWYYSVSSDRPSGRFVHGPPPPIGEKYSLQLSYDTHVDFVNITEQNVMTLDFWVFLTDTTPSDAWQMLFYATNTQTRQRDIEIRLWPDINRLRINLRTDEGLESIDTVSNLLPRRWYNIILTSINDRNTFNIYIEGILDSSSRLLSGTRQTANALYNHTFGRTNDLMGTNGYIGYYRITAEIYDSIEIKPGYRFIQSSKDPFVRHGCSSCTYMEAESIGKSMYTVGFQTQDAPDNSPYYVGSLEDLYLSEGFNTARIMGWFSTTSQDDDSGTIWIRDIDNQDRAEELEYNKIGLGGLRSI